MDAHSLKVGELAKRTGVSVRTLHHYDEIGLLKPSGQTVSGYRLYSRDDVARLQQIRSLRQIGLPLKRVGLLLNRPDHSPVEVLRTHAAHLRARVESELRLSKRLEATIRRLESDEDVGLTDLLATIKEIDQVEKFEKYYTPEQLKTLAARAEDLGPDGMQKANQDWADLIAEVQQAVNNGVDPASKQARSLAARWDALLAAFTGGDEGIGESLSKMYEAEPNIAADQGYRPDPRISGFISAARRP